MYLSVLVCLLGHLNAHLLLLWSVCCHIHSIAVCNVCSKRYLSIGEVLNKYSIYHARHLDCTSKTHLEMHCVKLDHIKKGARIKPSPLCVEDEIKLELIFQHQVWLILS